MATDLASNSELQLVQLPAGVHACIIDSAPAHQMSLLAPFLGEGIRRREQCLYVVDGSDKAEALARLEAEGLDATAAIESGALHVLTARDTYLRAGQFDPEAMVAFLRSTAETALAAGWTGVCGVGEMTWALGADIRAESLIQYEALLNEMAHASRMRLLCHYDRSRFPSAVVRDILRTHPHAILGDHVHENPYYEPASLGLDEIEADTARVNLMLECIQRRTRRTAAIAELGSWALEHVAPAELMKAAAHTIWQESCASIVEVFSFATQGDTAVRRAVAGLDGAVAVADRHFSLAEVWPKPAGDAGTEPLLVNDWNRAVGIALRAELAPHGVRSSAAVPIGAGRTRPAHGVVWLHSAEPRLFSDDEIMFVNTVAIMLGEAIGRMRAEDQFELVVEHAADVIARFDQAEAERAHLYPALIQQQARLTELISRLERDRARDKDLTAGVLQTVQLTTRQREVLRLLVKGWTNREIAAELSVSPGTIKNQVARIMAVLGATHRTDAAVRAVSIGVIDAD